MVHAGTGLRHDGIGSDHGSLPEVGHDGAFGEGRDVVSDRERSELVPCAIIGSIRVFVVVVAVEHRRGLSEHHAVPDATDVVIWKSTS